MLETGIDLRELLHNESFPLSAKYDPKWVMENQMGPHPLWLMEWLCRGMDLKPGMRVLDMGCGKALTSIFLAREFGVQVWATDLWIKPTENWRRIREAGLEDRVFPIYAEARGLPFAEGFFDAAVSVDSFHYYGTDDLYMLYFAKFVKPSGRIGVVVPGVTHELDAPLPTHLTRKDAKGRMFWEEDCWSFHSADWWRRLWSHTAKVGVELADMLPDGCRHWLQWERAVDAAKGNSTSLDAEVLAEDNGRNIGFVRTIAMRTAG